MTKSYKWFLLFEAFIGIICLIAAFLQIHTYLKHEGPRFYWMAIFFTVSITFYISILLVRLKMKYNAVNKEVESVAKTLQEENDSTIRDIYKSIDSIAVSAHRYTHSLRNGFFTIFKRYLIRPDSVDVELLLRELKIVSQDAADFLSHSLHELRGINVKVSIKFLALLIKYRQFPIPF